MRLSKKRWAVAALAMILIVVSAASLPSSQDLPPGSPAQERETDPAVLKKLEWFQDIKFGLMVHWGPYSQWGVVESWSICSEDEPWCARPQGISYVEYKKNYEALKTTFNPVKFDPDKWAAAARYAGMRYVVHTTKHHDGFCMFDTRQTDYRITDPGCPFHSDPRADIIKKVFESFRRQGFGIGAYFSKPDWHSPDYWAPEWATPDRNVNYDTSRYPERWRKFCDYTHKQIEELMTGYGPVDILWLDGGWVRPRARVFDPDRGLVKDPKDQDIDMPRIAALARSHQPGLLVVDRTVTGKYENYRTPEQQVPTEPLDYIWETCMTMGDSWSFRPDDVYKSPRRLIQLLVEIVSKGGNFLLNIGPDASGDFAPEAYRRLKDIGDWMTVNSRAIYDTRPRPPYRETKVCYSALKDGTVFALYLADEDETAPPSKIMLYGLKVVDRARVRMLGVKEPVRWERVGKALLLILPEAAVKNPPCRYVWAFEITP